MVIKSVAEHPEILQQIRQEAQSASTKEEFMSLVCRTLQNKLPICDWVGYYLVDPEGERQLVLGPFVGEPTEHFRIHFGEGICGQAAERCETFIVPDVRQESNYLSCSPRVLSEIVVPVLKEGKVVAELDIDSHQLDAFGPGERTLMERLAAMTAEWF